MYDIDKPSREDCHNVPINPKRKTSHDKEFKDAKMELYKEK